MLSNTRQHLFKHQDKRTALLPPSVLWLFACVECSVWTWLVAEQSPQLLLLSTTSKILTAMKPLQVYASYRCNLENSQV